MKSALAYSSAHPAVAGSIALMVLVFLIAVVRVLIVAARRKNAAAEARRIRAEQGESSEKLSYFFTRR